MDGNQENNQNVNNGQEGNENSNVNSNNDQTNSGEKTFTQEQVNGMMTKEKNEGKRAAFKSLGFDNEADAKAAIEEYNKYLESKKTDDEKNKENLDKANANYQKSLARAEKAENKLSCLMAGVNTESVDDVLAIAMTKVTEDNKLEDVLNKMKEETKYSSFFTSGSNNDNSNHNGTGRNPGHNGNGGKAKPGDYGARLAGGNANNDGKKSSFF